MITKELLAASLEAMPVCKTCGDMAAFPNARECTNCWEVEKRLETYVKSVNGRAFVKETLGQPVLSPLRLAALLHAATQRRAFYFGYVATGEFRPASDDGQILVSIAADVMEGM